MIAIDVAASEVRGAIRRISRIVSRHANTSTPNISTSSATPDGSIRPVAS